MTPLEWHILHWPTEARKPTAETMNPLSIFTRLHIALQRMVRWEFWPWQIVYLPVAAYWFLLAIKAKGWVFFSAANPCMRFGGLVAYSKADVIHLVPESYLPKTLIIEPESNLSELNVRLTSNAMSLPLIIKPDMGERGKGVKVLWTEAELNLAVSGIKERYLLQTYTDLPMELGVMYSRHPEEPNGRITSIVVKELPVLVGNGKSTLLELMLANLRTRLSYKIHLKRFKDRLSEIISPGEEIKMVTVGNHMLGTTFFNVNHLITRELEDVFDELAKKIEGFLIGRFDLKT